MNPPPNIVLCLCDQLRAFEVGCYGNDIIRTPQMDRLAQEGVRFHHAVTNNPVCMPARSCLLSGQYSRTCMGTLTNATEMGTDSRPYMPEYPVSERVHLPAPTLAESLRERGYETALIGKWHVHPAPATLGFDYSLYPRVHHRYTGQYYLENAGPEMRVEGDSVMYEAEQVRHWLTQPHPQPFFLFYSISSPHMPLMDSPDFYRTLYAKETVPLRPNVFKAGQMAYDEEWFRIYCWDFLYYRERLPHTIPLPEGFDLRDLVALYYGQTVRTDDMVGHLMTALRESGRAEKTIVVFTSDHGDNLGSHHLFNKQQLYEESIRIPLIFHAPERWMPRVNTGQVAQLMDVMPTLLAACGAESPPEIQGRNLLPILEGERETLEDASAFIETSDGQIGMRTPTHLYGARLASDFRAVADAPARFFDLRSDPYEMHNLADGGEQREVADEMRARLLAWHRDTPWLAA